MIHEKTNEILKTALQRNVSFEVNGKHIRKGKLILFNIKDFYISFNILTVKNTTKTYELPIPFEISQVEDGILCDFSVNNLIKKSSVREYLIKTIYNKLGKKSKIYDNKLMIRFIE